MNFKDEVQIYLFFPVPITDGNRGGVVETTTKIMRAD